MNNEKKEVTRVFDRLASTHSWENLYSGEINRLSYNFVTRLRAVEELLRSHTFEKAVDIGCGSGDLVSFFVLQGVRYVGVDLSGNMVKRAQVNYADWVRQGLADFQVADCECLPFSDGEFDVSSSVALIEYLPDAAMALDEMVRVTKPGGYVLLTVPNKNCINTRIRAFLKPMTTMLFPLYAKSRKASLASMRDVTHYSYSQNEIDALMQGRGLRKIDHRYANFHIIPHPLDHIMPKAYMRISDAVVRRKLDTSLRNWASNYIALYKKS